MKRTASSNGSSLTEKQRGAEQDEAQRAALVLLDMSSTDHLVPKPSENLPDRIYVPQKVRSSKQRKASKVIRPIQTYIQPDSSNTNIPVQTSRVYSQNRAAINQRNRMHRMKEFQPKKYQEHLDIKRKDYAKRYGKQDKDIQYRPHKKKETITNQTERNRRYEDRLRVNNPKMLKKIQESRKKTARECKRKSRLAKKMQKLKEGSAPDDGV